MINSIPYLEISKIYDHLMGKIDYKDWAEYLRDILVEYVDNTAEILELGSGTCKLVKYLKKYFPSYVATDLSIHMLKEAKKISNQRVCCDMRTLPFKKKFDVIISIFDSINYLLTVQDLKNTFLSVGEALTDEGVFTFDVSLPENSISCCDHLNREGKYKGTKYKQYSYYKPEDQIHFNEFEITLENGIFIKEIHKQRIYPLDVYHSVLKETGFFVMECLESFTFDDATDSSIRAQFVVKKEN